MAEPTRDYTTRKPTGLPTWPIGLLAGVDGSGKSFKLAEASGSDLIHRTFWIGVGEQDPDEYGQVPGARFEIVPTDGTYRDTLGAVEWATRQEPSEDGKPNFIVLDSGQQLWSMLSNSAQQTANERWANRKSNSGKEIPVDGVTITHDLWNVANSRWDHIIDALRAHQGPSFITARLKEVTIFENGEPTKEKRWKPEIQGSTPYAAGLSIQMRAQFPASDPHLVRVNSMRYKYETDAKGRPVARPLGHDWTIDGMWRQMGLDELVGERNHAQTVPQSADEEQAEVQRLLGEAVDEARANWNDVEALRRLMTWAGRAGLHGHLVQGPHGDMVPLANLINDRGRYLVSQGQGGDARAPQEPTPRQDARTVRAQEGSDARVQTQPQGEPDPAVGLTEDEERAQAASEQQEREAAAREQQEDRPLSRAEKQDRLMQKYANELEFQAETLGVALSEYQQPALNQDGSLSKVRAPKRILENREAVRDRLRENGMANVAEAYASFGGICPISIDVLWEKVEKEDREQVPQPQR